MSRYAVHSFFLATSIFAANSTPWTTGDFLPRTFQGTAIQFNQNSAFLATIKADVGGLSALDVTSMLTGAATVGGNGTWFLKGWSPDNLWVNVTSCLGTVNVAVSF